MTPPAHILEAAATVRNWMVQNGHRDWQLLGICDRSFAYKLGVCNEHYERLAADNTALRKLNDDLAATLRQTREKYGIGDRHVMREKEAEIQNLKKDLATLSIMHAKDMQRLSDMIDKRQEVLRHISGIMEEKNATEEDILCGSTAFKSLRSWASYFDQS